MKKIEFFKVEGDRINRTRKYCPKCGPGVFLAEHKDRFSCGKCGYTEFKGGSKSPKPVQVEEKTTGTSDESLPEIPKEKTIEAPSEVKDQPNVEDVSKENKPENPTGETSAEIKTEKVLKKQESYSE